MGRDAKEASWVRMISRAALAEEAITQGARPGGAAYAGRGAGPGRASRGAGARPRGGGCGRSPGAPTATGGACRRWDLGASNDGRRYRNGKMMSRARKRR
jgi:hypothetical protein